MSAVGSPPPPDLMKTYMLRSSTPASNEKGASQLALHSLIPRNDNTPSVLLYLEGMQRAPPEDEDPDNLSMRSSQAPSRVGSQKPPRSQASGKARSQASRRSRDPAAEVLAQEGAGGDEIRSDVQEQSEIARTVHIESMGPQGYVSDHFSALRRTSASLVHSPCTRCECAHTCMYSKSMLRNATTSWSCQR